MIDSPSVPPPVKPIFVEFKKKIAEMKPCVVVPNYQCILDAFINTGVKGMEKGVSLTHGPLQQVFQRMLNLDRAGIAEMKTSPGDGKHALQIANSVFHTKSEWIGQYLI